MNGMLDMPESTSVEPNQAVGTFEAGAMDHGLSFSEDVPSNAGEVTKPIQKFKSRHFPEPFWGHDD